MSVDVHQAPREIPTPLGVLLLSFSATVMLSVVTMNAVFSLASVSVLHPTLLTTKMIISAKAPVRPSHVASTASVHPLTLHSVCVYLVSWMGALLDVLTLMSAVKIPVARMPSVSMKLEPSNVSVHQECQVIPSWGRALALWQLYVILTMIVLMTWPVLKLVPASIHVTCYPVVPMLTARLKITPPGVAATQAMPRDPKATVCQCVRASSVVQVPTVLWLVMAQLASVTQGSMVTPSLEVTAYLTSAQVPTHARTHRCVSMADARSAVRV